MAHWLVMQGDTKFPVASLAELEALARRGGLRPGDMIQPPGTTEWLYATEIPELGHHIARTAALDDDEPAAAPGMSSASVGAIAGILSVVLAVVVVVFGGLAAYYLTQVGDPGEGLMEGGLRYSEMIVTTEGAGLRTAPEESASISTPVPKDDVLELLAKRGAFYRARTKNGAEGWIPLNQVIPMYQLGGSAVRQEFDPLYNPDRYVEVGNARWMLLPSDKGGQKNITVFEFMMTNNSKYPMTDLTLLATIKDAQGHDVERLEIPIEGVIPPGGSTFVGALSAEPIDPKKTRTVSTEGPPDQFLTEYTFDERAETDPDLQLRWTLGVGVAMKAENFANATVDIVQLRAVPDDAASEVVRREGE
jgi:hypothetical protein